MLSDNTYISLAVFKFYLLAIFGSCQIRNVLDAGRSVYEFEVFKQAFSHRIELKDVKQQGASEERF